MNFLKKINPKVWKWSILGLSIGVLVICLLAKIFIVAQINHGYTSVWSSSYGFYYAAMAFYSLAVFATISLIVLNVLHLILDIKNKFKIVQTAVNGAILLFLIIEVALVGTYGANKAFFFGVSLSGSVAGVVIGAAITFNVLNLLKKLY